MCVCVCVYVRMCDVRSILDDFERVDHTDLCGCGLSGQPGQPGVDVCMNPFSNGPNAHLIFTHPGTHYPAKQPTTLKEFKPKKPLLKPHQHHINSQVLIAEAGSAESIDWSTFLSWGPALQLMAILSFAGPEGLVEHEWRLQNFGNCQRDVQVLLLDCIYPQGLPTHINFALLANSPTQVTLPINAWVLNSFWLQFVAHSWNSTGNGHPFADMCRQHLIQGVREDMFHPSAVEAHDFWKMVASLLFVSKRDKNLTNKVFKRFSEVKWLGFMMKWWHVLYPSTGPITEQRRRICISISRSGAPVSDKIDFTSGVNFVRSLFAVADALQLTLNTVRYPVHSALLLSMNHATPTDVTTPTTVSSSGESPMSEMQSSSTTDLVSPSLPSVETQMSDVDSPAASSQNTISGMLSSPTLPPCPSLDLSDFDDSCQDVQSLPSTPSTVASSHKRSHSIMTGSSSDDDSDSNPSLPKSAKTVEQQQVEWLATSNLDLQLAGFSPHHDSFSFSPSK